MKENRCNDVDHVCEHWLIFYIQGVKEYIPSLFPFGSTSHTTIGTIGLFRNGKEWKCNVCRMLQSLFSAAVCEWVRQRNPQCGYGATGYQPGEAGWSWIIIRKVAVEIAEIVIIYRLRPFLEELQGILDLLKKATWRVSTSISIHHFIFWSLGRFRHW